VGEAQGSEFLKVEADGEDLQEIKAEVVEREVQSAVKTVEELKSKGKEATRFVGDRTYDANAV